MEWHQLEAERRQAEIESGLLSNRLALLELERNRSRKRMDSEKRKALLFLQHRLSVLNSEVGQSIEPRRPSSRPSPVHKRSPSETPADIWRRKHDMYLEGRRERSELEREQQKFRESCVAEKRSRTASIRNATSLAPQAAAKVQASKRDRVRSDAAQKIFDEKQKLAERTAEINAKEQREAELMGSLAAQRKVEETVVTEIDEILKTRRAEMTRNQIEDLIRRFQM